LQRQRGRKAELLLENDRDLVCSNVAEVEEGSVCVALSVPNVPIFSIDNLTSTRIITYYLSIIHCSLITFRRYADDYLGYLIYI
jgi:hypothetical protein